MGWGGGGGGGGGGDDHLSLGTIVLTENQGEGSFVSRKNDSNCRTTECGRRGVICL